MIKLFRKIRKQLLGEGKTGNYFKYAIGEIILVVIGILIALQINNWNEANSNEKRLLKIFEEIGVDLATDIRYTNDLIKSGNRIDSLSSFVLNNKLTKADYLNPINNRLFWIVLRFSPYKFRKTGFNKFKNFQGIIPEKYNKIVSVINRYYNDLGTMHDFISERLTEQMKDRHDYLVHNFDWYHLLMKNEITDEMIDFYVNNPIYKNWVSQHKVNNSSGKSGSIRRIHIQAISLILILNETLQTNYSFLNSKYSFRYKEILNRIGKPLLKDEKDIVGLYINEKVKLDVKVNGGYLFINNNLLIKKSKDTFKMFSVNSSSPKFESIVRRDSKGKVLGLYEIVNDSIISFVKKITND